MKLALERDWNEQYMSEHGVFFRKSNEIVLFLVNMVPRLFQPLFIIETTLHELVHWFLSHISSETVIGLKDYSYFKLEETVKDRINESFDDINRKVQIDLRLFIKHPKICGECWVKQTNGGERLFKGLKFNSLLQLKNHVKKEHKIDWGKYLSEWIYGDIQYLIIQSDIIKNSKECD